MSADTSILPGELTVTPLPLVGIAGLDIIKNPVHKTIWEAFSYNRKSDRAQIQFKLLPHNYEFPVSKPKRQSYEWYQPKGILKKNWMQKHLQVLPAVVVLFQDIEWNDTQWSEKQLQCASLVQTLKNSLQGQNTKLAIALLQTGTPMPPGEDLQATERNAHLASACDINPKLIFVLPHNDHLLGYTFRLESSFLELAQSYYTQMAKQIRLHRDQLTDAHLALKIRHQFKLGMIAEIRMDTQAALKNYVAAYAHLDEIRIIDTNCLEIKTIAGFLNYKICRLMFRGVPRDAIGHFKAHVDRFRGRTGFKELLFEHYAWLSLQYSAFAELFCDAIKFGLPALQTQHPGIYFHKAAEYVGKRKEAYVECVAHASSAEPLASNAFYSEFFGVRSTKIGDPITEQQVVAAVQAIEKGYNHSQAVIMLLGQAMAQFKMYKCLRFRKKLAVDMAEEYLKIGDHSKALTLYSLMLSDYRVDRWCNVFTEVLSKTLQSAYMSTSVVDFITCSVESLSPKITIGSAERLVIFDNLWRVLQNSPPNGVAAISKQWEVALSKFRSPVNIDLDKLTDLFECVVTFDKAQIKHDEHVQLTLFIRSKSEVPLKLKDFTLVLADSSLNFKLKAEAYAEQSPDHNGVDIQTQAIDGGGILLQPTVCYRLSFSAGQYKFTENEELSILRLDMTMGADKNHAVLSLQTGFNKAKQFKAYNPHRDTMADVTVNSTCYIVPTFHLSALNNLTNQPMLTNEYFKAESVVTNTFDVSLQNVGVSITVPASFKNKVFITADLTSKSSQRLQSNIQIDIGDLQQHNSTVVQYYVISLMEGNIDLTQKIWYQIDNVRTDSVVSNIIVESPLHRPSPPPPPPAPSLSSQPLWHGTDKPTATANRNKNHNNMNIEYLPNEAGVRKYREDIVIIPCVEEFNVRGRFYTLNKQALSRALRHEDFLLRIDVELKANCDIDILDMFLISDHNITEKAYSKQRKKLGIAYAKGQKLCDVKILHAHNATVQWHTHDDYVSAATNKTARLFQHRNSITRLTVSPSSDRHSIDFGAALPRREDKFKTNLLAKIPINSTIVGSTNLLTGVNQMNRSLTDQLDGGRATTKSKVLPTDSMSSSFHESISTGDLMAAAAAVPLQASGTVRALVKHVYHKAIDAFSLSDHCKGFLKEYAIADGTVTAGGWPVFGVYCIRWRRNGCSDENESKFVIQGIEVVEPPLNIYCYLDDKMYVKVPMTLRITIRNSSRTAMRLKTCLKNSESFMFSGNTQLNISIYSYSSYDLSFNLYPLKAGWQDLPEFEIKYNTQHDDVTTVVTTLPSPLVRPGELDDEVVRESANLELQSLVTRWMPKRVFILPMMRHIH